MRISQLFMNNLKMKQEHLKTVNCANIPNIFKRVLWRRITLFFGFSFHIESSENVEIHGKICYLFIKAYGIICEQLNRDSHNWKSGIYLSKSLVVKNSQQWIIFWKSFHSMESFAKYKWKLKFFITDSLYVFNRAE